MGVSQEVTGDDYILEVSFEGIRAFLNALPEPQDDWIECAFEDIQKGDRVRIVTENFYTEYDHPVLEVGQTSICSTILFACGTRAFLDDYNALYRIPAPVVTPNPAEYPVILVTAADRVAYDQPEPHVWDGEAYSALDRALSYLMPTQITDWSPAKVVADDE